MELKHKCKKHTTNSFFGEFLYEQVLPKNHFLVKAKQIIDWDRFSGICFQWYRWSGKDGRAPYNPAMMLRILFLCYLYNLSERQIEERVNLDISFKYFVGLGIDERPPDHSSLTYFKNRLLKGGGGRAYENLLKEILEQATLRGIKFGQIQIIDSVHTIANVNPNKDESKRKDKKPPRDPDASWGVKRDKKVKDENGRERKVPEYFYGYKSHVSLNAKTHLVTSLETTPGNRYDGHHLESLVGKDSNLGKLLPQKKSYTADKGYDSIDNHQFLGDNQLGDAICLNNYRTKKKNGNKEIWLKLQQSKTYQKGLKERYKIEQAFGIKKNNHGLRRCRYLGAEKFNLQAHLTAIAYNLAVVVASLTGHTLKGYARCNTG